MDSEHAFLIQENNIMNKRENHRLEKIFADILSSLKDATRFELKDMGIDDYELLETDRFTITIIFKNQEDLNLYKLIGKYGEEKLGMVDAELKARQ